MTRRLSGFLRLPSDVRYALQQLRRHPALAAVITLSLAIGVGANTAIFSVFNAVMLRGVAVHDPARLMVLQYTGPNGEWPAALDHTHSGRGGLDAAGRPVSVSISWPSFVYMQSFLEALVIAAAGIAAGALLASGGARYVRSLLFEVTPLDGPTVTAAVLVMLAVALAAAYLPARRASRLDPLKALREE